MSPPTIEIGTLACAGCGCTDEHGCRTYGVAETCHWMAWIQHPGGVLGLCSYCAPSVAYIQQWMIVAPRACVAPDWPEWVSDEDGEWYWIRADVAHQAGSMLARDICDPGEIHLNPVAAVPMFRVGYSGYCPATDEPDEAWALAEADPADHDTDQVLYIKFEG